MTTTQTASERIVEEATAWDGVTANMRSQILQPA